MLQNLNHTRTQWILRTVTWPKIPFPLYPSLQVFRFTSKRPWDLAAVQNHSGLIPPLGQMQKENTKSGMGCFFMNFLVLTTHPQQRESNTGSQISLPGSPTPAQKAKRAMSREPADSCLSFSCISQAHRERNCSTRYSCRIPGIHKYCKTRSKSKRTSKRKEQGSPPQKRKKPHTHKGAHQQERENQAVQLHQRNRICEEAWILRT